MTPFSSFVSVLCAHRTPLNITCTGHRRQCGTVFLFCLQKWHWGAVQGREAEPVLAWPGPSRSVFQSLSFSVSLLRAFQKTDCRCRQEASHFSPSNSAVVCGKVFVDL